MSESDIRDCVKNFLYPHVAPLMRATLATTWSRERAEQSLENSGEGEVYRVWPASGQGCGKLARRANQVWYPKSCQVKSNGFMVRHSGARALRQN
jgi:hypothetical protein